MLSLHAKLGLFVLSVSTAFAFLVVTFGEIPFFKKEGKVYITYFEDVAGLSKGAEVRVAGIRAGKVREVLLEGGKVKVIFEVDPEVEIYANARTFIGTLGLMGDKFLGVDPGDPSKGTLPKESEVKSEGTVADTDKLIGELTRTAESFRIVAERLNQILEENRKNLRVALENLQSLTATLDEIAKENQRNLRDLIENLSILTADLVDRLPRVLSAVERLANDLDTIAVENRKDIKDLVSNLKEFSEVARKDLPLLVKNLNDLSEVLRDTISENRRDIRESIKNIARITDRLKKTSLRLDNILAKIEEGKGTLGKLVNDPELYENVTKGAKLFGEAGEVITKTRLFVGFGGEAYSSGDGKGFVSIRLEPDRKTYYLLEIVGDSRGRVYTEEIIGEGERVKKEFRPEITLQIAKSFSFVKGTLFTVRAGLKESTGGVGAEISKGRKWRLYSDLWDTGRKDRPQDKGLRPNLQVGLQLRLKGPLFVRFGGDDLLNAKLRGVFAGAGLEFSDDYLKYLIGGMGVPLP